MKRSKLRSVSPKRAKINREYAALAKAFLESNPICGLWLAQNGYFRAEGYEPRYNKGQLDYGSVTPELLKSIGAPESTQIHHKKGRGKWMLDAFTWMAVSDAGHRYIHVNPKESYMRGHLLPRNT